jgi:hypothetical protein
MGFSPESYTFMTMGRLQTTKTYYNNYKTIILFGSYCVIIEHLKNFKKKEENHET